VGSELKAQNPAGETSDKTVSINPPLSDVVGKIIQELRPQRDSN